MNPLSWLFLKRRKGGALLGCGNCFLDNEAECRMPWSRLRHVGGSEGERHCGRCDSPVVRVRDNAERLDAVSSGRCYWIDERDYSPFPMSISTTGRVTSTPGKGCDVEFDFVCEKKWEDLVPSARLAPTTRYCRSCAKDVHLCRNAEEVRYYAKRGECVSVVSTDLLRVKK